MTPVQIQIDGPSAIMQAISEFSTDIIDLDGRSNDFIEQITILNRDPLIMMRGNGTTEFRGIIQQKLGIQNFENLPIQINGLAAGLSAELNLNSGSIRLEGPQLGIQRYTPPANLLYLDLSSIRQPGAYNLPVRVRQVNSLNVVRVEPASVRVTVKADQAEGGGGERSE
jgi:hypothetical protein